MRKIILPLLVITCSSVYSQNVMTPELLWKLGRVNGECITPDQQNIIYSVRHFDMNNNKGSTNLYSVPAIGGASKQLTKTDEAPSNVLVAPDGKMGYLYKGQFWESNWDGTAAKQLSNIKGDIDNLKFSPDGKYVLYSQTVKVDNTWQDRYPDLTKAAAHESDQLMYRHWDTWADGTYNHIFYATYYQGKIGDGKDIMDGEAFDCPTKPDGDASDVVWDGVGEGIFYVCKKKSGKDYALSTNSDIYHYSIQTGKTIDVTEDFKGYDTQPAIAPNGTTMAWTGMATDGYEADKNDLLVADIYSGKHWNLTKDWDETVNSFHWSTDGKKIYFLAYKNATEQVFELTLESNPDNNSAKDIKQLTRGVHDLNSILGQSGDWLICSMTDMNHAAEIVRVNVSTGEINNVTTVNKLVYDGISISKIDTVWVKTTDNKKMLTWVIYPPNYDSTKRYPALLFCQGGPQVCLSQTYSFRWNFQLMAANGYIVIAPCRRGMPGFGVEWNKEISGDWGGQDMQDYLSAVDSIRKWPSVFQNRIGCVGASYGGYSAYMLEGMNGGRFKTFIAHCGSLDLVSWYNSTEEIWFANYDLGGSWWQTPQPKSYTEFNPLTYVDKWNTPLMVIEGELDFRIPYTQGLEAFQILQSKGIKSRLLVFSDEGHWILKPQDGLLWQREFFRWLNETL